MKMRCATGTGTGRGTGSVLSANASAGRLVVLARPAMRLMVATVAAKTGPRRGRSISEAKYQSNIVSASWIEIATKTALRTTGNISTPPQGLAAAHDASASGLNTCAPWWRAGSASAAAEPAAERRRLALGSSLRLIAAFVRLKILSNPSLFMVFVHGGSVCRLRSKGMGSKGGRGMILEPTEPLR